jgi:hypothetical protein
VFFDLVHKKFSEHLQNTPPPSNNFSPPSEFHQIVIQMQQICVSFQSTLITESKEKKEIHFLPVINSFVDPLLKFSFLSCQFLTNSKEKLVFLVNCFLCIHHEIQRYDFAASVSLKISQMVEEYKQKLIEEEVDFFF